MLRNTKPNATITNESIANSFFDREFLNFPTGRLYQILKEVEIFIFP